MALSTILGSIAIGVLCLIIVIYFAIQVEKYARRKWMQASARQIMALSAMMIAMFSILLLAAIIRVGLLIWSGEIK